MKIAIYGAGGFGREVAPLVQAAHHAADILFVSDERSEIGRRVNGIETLSYDVLLKDHRDRAIAVAIADHKARRAIVDKCAKAGFKFCDIVAGSHRSYAEVTVGEGAIVCDNTIFTSNIRIGRHFHANIYSYVGHDCVIGDFVTFAPRVSCNGRIIIEDDVYVGTGAILKPGQTSQPLVIGKGSIIGMGAVVTKDVAPGVVVIGNPARRMDG